MSISTDPARSLLLGAKEAARLLDMSEEKFRRLDQQGRVPSPIRLSRFKKWSRFELIEWVKARCPNRKDWESRR